MLMLLLEEPSRYLWYALFLLSLANPVVLLMSELKTWEQVVTDKDVAKDLEFSSSPSQERGWRLTNKQSVERTRQRPRIIPLRSVLVDRLVFEKVDKRESKHEKTEQVHSRKSVGGRIGSLGVESEKRHDSSSAGEERGNNIEGSVMIRRWSRWIIGGRGETTHDLKDLAIWQMFDSSDESSRRWCRGKGMKGGLRSSR